MSCFTEQSQKNIEESSEPRPILEFDRKYKGCSDIMKTDDRCGNESWSVDFTIPSEMFPSGLSKINLKDEGDDQVLVWWVCIIVKKFNKSYYVNYTNSKYLSGWY